MKVPFIDMLNTGSKRSRLYLQKNYPEFYDSLRTDVPLPEALYLYFHGEPKPCPVCGKKPAFISFSKGYSKYCGPKCANSDPAKKEKVKQTCMERYGVPCSSQAESTKQKARQTCMERYGQDYYVQQKVKRVQTNLERYGVEHGLMSPVVRERIKQTCMERYGVDNILQVPGHKQKMKDAVIAKYGVDNVLKLPQTWDKIHKTCMERYGFETPFESPEIQKQCAHHDTGIEIFIQTILDAHGIGYIREDPNVISPARVDFSIPSKKLAIEVNGTYWHSDRCKSPRHHLDRFQYCERAGWRMITIWEDQIIRIPEIVESVVLSKLGIYKRRLHARKCVITEIDSQCCSNFLEHNHIQGRTSSQVRLGAYINDELVGVMTFIQSRGCQGSKVRTAGQWELNRFCTLLNTQVIGLTSKMLKHFIRHHQPNSVISFSHNDISDGNVYSKLGFTKIGRPNASYYYIKSNVRYHRSNFTRAGIVRRWPEYDINDRSWTERQVMNDKNYYRIYDCGTQKWIKYFDNTEIPI